MPVLLLLQSAIYGIYAFYFLKLGVYGCCILALGGFANFLQQTTNSALVVIATSTALNHVGGEMSANDVVCASIKDSRDIIRYSGPTSKNNL